MSLCEEFFKIFTAFIAWLCGGMLRQQNNERPSYSYAPTISDSKNSQYNAIQVDSANYSTIHQNPKAEEATQSKAAQQPARKDNIKSSPLLRQKNNGRPSYSYAPTISDSTNSQYNAIQADSANYSNIQQHCAAEEATQSNAAQQPARKHKKKHRR